MSLRIKKIVAAALVVVGMYAACAQSAVRDLANVADAYLDSSREKREQETAPTHIKEIFALAKKSAEEDFNVNFCGFFAGMSRHDAQALAEYYRLKDGEYSMDAAPGKAVSGLWFSLKGVRRITKGGSTLDELAQSVANRVGDLKKNYATGEYEHKTIDGVVVKLGHKGLTIKNDGIASQTPLATAAAAQKDKADADAAQKAAAEEAERERAAREIAQRAAAEEAARKERADKEAISRLIRDMIAIPGKRFKMGKYEVTQAQWQAVMGENPSNFKGDENPVEEVSWNDCKKFIEKLNALPEVKTSGLTFRLPTEAEWEYACRAGGTGDYCRLKDESEITKDTLARVAWYYTNSDGGTHSVGQKEPNSFGLYDMHGNVWEFCWEMDKEGKPLNFVIKGGSWFYYSGLYGATLSHVAKECEVSFENSHRRFFNLESNGRKDVGLRLVALTKEEVARIKEEKEAALQKAKEEQETAKEAAIREKKEIIPGIIKDMVAIPGKNFLIGKYEVTQKQWGALMDSKPGNFKGDNHPVVISDWYRGRCAGNPEYYGEVFLERLNATPEVKAAGLTFRLPTEAEWEYACHGGKKVERSFWSGKVDYGRLVDGTKLTEKTLGKVAWYLENSNRKTHPVGQKMPNAFGLYDMFGNANELCVEKKERKRKHSRSRTEEEDEEYEQFDRLMIKGGSCCMSDYAWAKGETTWYFSGVSDNPGFRLVADQK